MIRGASGDRTSPELDHEARELLAQVDAEYAPSRADRARVHARVLQSLAGLPVSLPSAEHPKLDQVADAARDGASGWSAALGIKSLMGALVIGVACFGAGFFAGRQTAPVIVQPPTLPQTPTPAPAPTATLPEPKRESPRKSADGARGAAKSARTPEPSSAVERPAAAALPSSGDGGEPLEVHTSALWQETQLLQRAQRALASGNAQLSQALLDELAAEFPEGVLIEERTAVRILTECALGRVAQARAQARRFEVGFPTSVHAERLRGSCAGNPAGLDVDSTAIPEAAEREP